MRTRHLCVSRKINVVSQEIVKELKCIKLKSETKAKVNLGINVYNKWHNYRLHTFNYDIAIHFRDLNNSENLTKHNLNTALCEFIPKVTLQEGRGVNTQVAHYITQFVQYTNTCVLIKFNGNF